MTSSHGTLRICTPGGQEWELPFSGAQTVAQIKDQLLADMEKRAANLRLLHGTVELEDDWVLSDHGIEDGAQLTQIVTAFPTGIFKLGNYGGLRGGPAGRNTSAFVDADFRDDGTFCIKVEETEITSLIRGPDWDPYEEGAAFGHDYDGTVAAGRGSQLVLSVLGCERKGNFREEKPTRLLGEFSQEMAAKNEVKLELPFEAGACNEGRAGLRWVTLSQNPPEEDPLGEDEELRGEEEFLDDPRTRHGRKSLASECQTSLPHNVKTKMNWGA